MCIRDSINYLVENCVKHGLRPPGKQLLIRFQSLSNARQVWRLSMADRDDEVQAHEYVDFAELHFLCLIHIPCRS